MTSGPPPVVEDRRPWRSASALLALLLGCGLAVFGGRLAWDRYHEKYVVERADDGAAITRIAAARFAGASALKVGELAGTVQATASDVRGFGMLHSDKVVKAPFSADYFVDVSKLGSRDLRWDATSRTLVVDVPDVTVGRVNVDEAARSLSQTRGLFVTRDAADQLGRVVSLRARQAAATEARRPERLAQARERARIALGNLLSAPLASAGHGDVTVILRFPWEGGRSTERWDRSRNLEQVRTNQF